MPFCAAARLQAATLAHTLRVDVVACVSGRDPRRALGAAIEEIVATRKPSRAAPRSTSTCRTDVIALVGSTHHSEILNRAPGDDSARRSQES
jgi:hypothetical protein